MLKNKIVLGTVQFGLNYGINNTSGKPTEKEVFDILDFAYKNNIECLDTADVYGDAIKIIGNYHKQRKNIFKIYNKFKLVKKGDLFIQAKSSLEKLQIAHFDIYSFHSFNDFANNQYAIDELLKLKNDGLVKKIGISVYTNIECEKVIESDIFDVIQIPYNILDNNNKRGYLIDKAKAQNKNIHVRSVFLQGLFFMDDKNIPEKLNPLRSYIHKIKNYCTNKSISIQTLALSYNVYNSKIDKVLLGADNTIQLNENLKSIKQLDDAFKFIDNNIVVNETELLNPANWK